MKRGKVEKMGARARTEQAKATIKGKAKTPRREAGGLIMVSGVVGKEAKAKEKAIGANARAFRALCTTLMVTRILELGAKGVNHGDLVSFVCWKKTRMRTSVALSAMTNHRTSWRSQPKSRT